MAVRAPCVGMRRARQLMLEVRFQEQRLPMAPKLRIAKKAERSARLRFVGSSRQALKLCRPGKLHGFFVDAYGWVKRVGLTVRRTLPVLPYEQMRWMAPAHGIWVPKCEGHQAFTSKTGAIHRRHRQTQGSCQPLERGRPMRQPRCAQFLPVLVPHPVPGSRLLFGFDDVPPYYLS
jgi:hypothetical protein